MSGVPLSGNALLDSAVLFVWSFLSSFGIPGGLAASISAGAFATSIVDLLFIMLIVAIASMLGDIAAYELARRFSGVVYEKLSKYKWYRSGEAKVRKALQKNEFWLIFFTRWLFISLCSVVSYISGLERLDRKRYIIAVVTGELCYGIVFAGIGYFFKQTWSDVATFIGYLLGLTVLVGLALVVVRLLLSKRSTE